MTTMFIEKINIKDLEDTLANSTALLALVGASDLAVEKLRALRDELTLRAAALDTKGRRDQAQATFASRVEGLQSELMAAPERIQALPERIQALPEKAQEWPTKAQSLFADVLSTAFSTYGELAGRGKTRVAQVRRDASVGVEVDVEVEPVSRPTKKTAAKKPASKKTATSKTTANKTAGTKAATKKSKPVAKKTSTASTQTGSTPTAPAGTASTDPATSQPTTADQTPTSSSPETSD